jgi:site-specific DNA-methyltransferase (adenine-specific)
VVRPYYEHGGITIYHGEAREVLGVLPAGSIGGVVTDPPYSSGGQYRTDRANRSAQDKYLDGDRALLPDFSGDNRDQRGFLAWASLWMGELLAVVVDGAPMFAFTDWRQLPTMTDAVQCGGWNWQGLFVWDKCNGRPQKNRPTQSVEYIVYAVAGQVRQEPFVCPAAIIRAAVPNTDDRQHVTEKPVEAILHLLPLVTGAVVLDPFMGSGTTLRAAKDLGRKAIGIEIEERYCEIAAKRLSQEVLFGEASA